MVVFLLVVDGAISGLGLENSSHLIATNRKTPKININMVRPSDVGLLSLSVSCCSSFEALSRLISSRLIELTSNTLSLPIIDFNAVYSLRNCHSRLDSLLRLHVLTMATADRIMAIMRIPAAIESNSKFLFSLAINNIVRNIGVANITTATQVAVVEFWYLAS